MARPSEFDRDKVIDQALYAFRIKGYIGTSVRDLEKATGLKPGSIYSAFGNKRRFFLETLTCYFGFMRTSLRNALAGQSDPVVGLRNFFDWVINSAVSPAPEQCCYVVKSALELSNTDADVQKLIIEHFEIMHSLIAGAITAAQASGRISSARDPRVVARLLLNNLFGLNVESMLAPDRELLTAMVDELFNAITLEVAQEAESQEGRPQQSMHQ